MCGIYGFSRTTKYTDRMTPVLAIAMSTRGKDSWGVTDGLVIHKELGDITDTYFDAELEAPLYHTRHATIGAVSKRNSHPFRFEHNGVVVVGAHNGHINNHWAIKDKYHRDTVEVDSEHIFQHLAEGKPLSDIGGYGAVVWYEYDVDKPQERVRYFSRFNHSDLHFAKLVTGEIAFCSTKKALDMAATLAGTNIEFYYDTEPLIQYTIENDQLMQMGKLDWGAAPVQWTSGFNHVAGVNRGNNWNNTYLDKDQCPVLNCKASITKDQFMCDIDFQLIRDGIYVDTATV